MKLSWKLLPIAAVSALALLALMPGGGARPADVSADVTDVTIAAEEITSGNNVNIEIDALQNDGVISVVLEGAAGGTTPSFQVTECGDCDDEGDVGSSLSINSSDIPISGTITVRLTLTCTTQDNVVVRATQDGVSDTDSLTCNPNTTPTVTPTTTGTPSTATPTVTTTPTGDTITLSAVQPNPQCGQAVFLFATVKNNAGAFVSGATVAFSSSGGGTFSPTSATTVTDGVASSTFTPPTTGTTTLTITAVSNGKTATASVPVNCGTAATSTPVPPAATATPISQVRPPSTGEAGLADGSNLSLYAGIAALVGTAFMGALVVARRRA